MRQVSRTEIPNTIWLDDVDWLLLLNKSFCNMAKSKNSSKLIDSSSLLLFLLLFGGDVNFTEFFSNPSRTMSGTSPTWILALSWCLGILWVSIKEKYMMDVLCNVSEKLVKSLVKWNESAAYLFFPKSKFIAFPWLDWPIEGVLFWCSSKWFGGAPFEQNRSGKFSKSICRLQILFLSLTHFL